MAGNDRFGAGAYAGRRRSSGGGSNRVIEISSTIEDLGTQLTNTKMKVAQQIASYGKAVAEGNISVNQSNMNNQLNKFLDAAGIQSDAERMEIMTAAFVLLAHNTAM